MQFHWIFRLTWSLEQYVICICAFNTLRESLKITCSICLFFTKYSIGFLLFCQYSHCSWCLLTRVVDLILSIIDFFSLYFLVNTKRGLYGLCTVSWDSPWSKLFWPKSFWLSEFQLYFVQRLNKLGIHGSYIWRDTFCTKLIGLCICDPFAIFHLIKGWGAGAQIVEKLIEWMLMICLAFIGDFSLFYIWLVIFANTLFEYKFLFRQYKALHSLSKWGD